ncbi:eukaryotic translation initiation factor 4E-1-like [Selaginella moellendorffii]|uniref:eukaryotic translation initiation factor 4E-1-like n=1 Tax=Selaginella moellendorffii TaxID=88036 RepID=UPI000D1C99CF|nr:eukaryotic translation initiation factor 4E-1-like [Selaginella moellendorffii]|eukprot:XP_024544509.1 eukaryotic translation initiation factor 4E-1-like [Selaginella moellendorffii]
MVEVEKAPMAMPVDASEREEGEIVASPKSIVKEKHPLEHSWTFWFDNPSGKNKQQQWGSSLRPVYTVSTVEDFWCGADFHCFKEGIKPEWEDPRCANGGKWTAAPPRGSKQALDQFWLNTVGIREISLVFHRGFSAYILVLPAARFDR